MSGRTDRILMDIAELYGPQLLELRLAECLEYTIQGFSTSVSSIGSVAHLPDSRSLCKACTSLEVLDLSYNREPYGYQWHLSASVHTEPRYSIGPGARVLRVC